MNVPSGYHAPRQTFIVDDDEPFGPRLEGLETTGDPQLSGLIQKELLVAVVDLYVRKTEWPLGHADTQRFIDAASDEEITSRLDAQTRESVEEILIAIIVLQCSQQSPQFSN